MQLKPNVENFPTAKDNEKKCLVRESMEYAKAIRICILNLSNNVNKREFSVKITM